MLFEGELRCQVLEKGLSLRSQVLDIGLSGLLEAIAAHQNQYLKVFTLTPLEDNLRTQSKPLRGRLKQFVHLK